MTLVDSDSSAKVKRYTNLFMMVFVFRLVYSAAKVGTNIHMKVICAQLFLHVFYTCFYPNYLIICNVSRKIIILHVFYTLFMLILLTT